MFGVDVALMAAHSTSWFPPELSTSNSRDFIAARSRVTSQLVAWTTNSSGSRPWHTERLIARQAAGNAYRSWRTGHDVPNILEHARSTERVSR